MKLSNIGELTLLLVAMLTIMVGAALAPGLGSIAHELGVGDYATLLLTLPAFGAIMFAPLFGMLIDRIGARTILLASLWGYFIFGVGGMFLHGPWLVAIDRIVLGGFAAGVMASGTAVISQWYQGTARLNMIAKQGMAIELGGVVFLFAGGILSEWHWQAPFLLYVMGFVCFLMTKFWVPPVKAAEVLEPVDVSVSTFGANSLRPIVIFAVLAMGVFFSLVVTLPQFLAELSYSEAETGYVLSFISFMAVMSAMVMPKMVKQVKAQNTLVIAFISYAIAHCVFAFNNGMATIVLASIFAGIGFGFSIPLLNHLTVEVSTDKNRGRNLSKFAMAVFAGQFVTSIFDFLDYSHHNVLLFCAVIAAVCSILIGVNKSAKLSALAS